MDENNNQQTDLITVSQNTSITRENSVSLDDMDVSMIQEIRTFYINTLQEFTNKPNKQGLKDELRSFLNERENNFELFTKAKAIINNRTKKAKETKTSTSKTQKTSESAKASESVK